MARKRRYSYDYPRAMVAVDCVALRLAGERLRVLLIRRGHSPYKGRWALPGGFIKIKETLEATALRELREETGVEDISVLIQLGAYGEPRRDPRGRVIGVAFIGIVPSGRGEATAGDDADGAMWYPIEELPPKIAFDHTTIIGDALGRLLAEARTSGLLFAFLGKHFTEAEFASLLRAVYGVELGAKEYLAPFRHAGLVKKTKNGRKCRFVGVQKGRR